MPWCLRLTPKTSATVIWKCLGNPCLGVLTLHWRLSTFLRYRTANWSDSKSLWTHELNSQFSIICHERVLKKCCLTLLLFDGRSSVMFWGNKALLVPSTPSLATPLLSRHDKALACFPSHGCNRVIIMGKDHCILHSLYHSSLIRKGKYAEMAIVDVYLKYLRNSVMQSMSTAFYT